MDKFTFKDWAEVISETIRTTFWVFVGVGGLIYFGILIERLIQKDKPKTKTCYVTEWRWEKSSNGVRVRVPVKQVCVKGDGDVSSK